MGPDFGNQFLICSVHDEEEKVLQGFYAGAGGYLLKTTAPHHLLESIHELNGGGAPISKEIAKILIQSLLSIGMISGVMNR